MGIILAAQLGCDTLDVGPKKVVKVPAVNNRESILAIEYGLSMSVSPSPAPDDDTDKVKVGDTCPKCKGTGKKSTDGAVPLDCFYCNGDGKVNEGDPILDVVAYFQNKLQVIVKSIDESVNQKLNDFKASLPQEPEYEDVEEEQSFVYFKGSKYILNEQKTEFVDSAGFRLVVKDQSLLDTGVIRVCLGNHCQLIPIEKELITVRRTKDGKRDKKTDNKVPVDTKRRRSSLQAHETILSETPKR